MKRLAAIFHLSLFLFTLTAAAAVPIRWTVETSRAQPVSFDAYHGETLELEAAFKAYGKPLQAPAPAALWYQTNGMGAAWWSVPATVSSNTVSATLAPASDPGASVLNCFLGGTASTYRAAFQIRFRNSPGATPNQLALPSVTYDAALFGTPTINGTNLTAWVAARSQAESDPVFAEWVRTNDFSSAGGGSGGIDTNAVKDIVADAVSGKQDKLDESEGVYVIQVASAMHASFADGSNQATYDGSLNNIESTYATKETVSNLNQTVAAWETYWDGAGVRVTVTNYFGALDVPSLYIEQNTNTAPGGASVYRTVWDERTRWNSFLAGYTAFTNDVRQNYADRAWGAYDSSTGGYSPDGLLQISQGEIQIASGLAYQKTITTGGCAVWVLAATEPTTVSGVTSNGFFRITDGNGDTLFEIVRGDKRTVGATASAITAGNGMTITYNVNSESHPTLQLAADLSGTWYSETECSAFATVSWSGSSGAWVASVTPVGSQPKMFAQARYVTGGDTYIRNSAPIGFSNVYIGGTNYAVHVESMNGKKVLVLE